MESSQASWIKPIHNICIPHGCCVLNKCSVLGLHHFRSRQNKECYLWELDGTGNIIKIYLLWGFVIQFTGSLNVRHAHCPTWQIIVTVIASKVSIMFWTVSSWTARVSEQEPVFKKPPWRNPTYDQSTGESRVPVQPGLQSETMFSKYKWWIN
jgi:hypothetical protein